MNWRHAQRRALGVAGLLVIAALPTLSYAPTASGDTSSTVSALSETITRDHVVSDGNGGFKDDIVDTRTVSLTVSETQNLRNQQQILVNWTGAHPTGGITSPVTISSQAQEYPMVLLQCRGTDPTPSTCWTHGTAQRYQDFDAGDGSAGDNASAAVWQLDRYASADERAPVVDAPTPLPSACEGLSFPTQRWVPYVAADGTNYPVGPLACAGLAPDDSTQDGSGLGGQTNATFAATAADGSGSYKYPVSTADSNPSLGCSAAVPCSLVAIPIMGLSCDKFTGLNASDSALAESTCQQGGYYQPGQPFTSSGGNLSVEGALWWSASNWRNRIVVPLTFAQTASVCSQVDGDSTVDVYGSPLMNEAASQWQPKFCQDSTLTPFNDVQISDSQARIALSNSLLGHYNVDAIFGTNAGDQSYSFPTVNAPVAMTGFAISYVIDDANHKPYTTLKMTPRLLAKLLTESYPTITMHDEYVRLELAAQKVHDEVTANFYAPLANNPQYLTEDPEFIALNPGVPDHANDSQAALLALSGDSDMMRALTTYINTDPEARAWLNGAPDPWGMVVNPAYLGIALPVGQWPLLDTSVVHFPAGTNLCPEVPYLPLLAAPQASLFRVEQDVQFAVNWSQTACNPTGGVNASGQPDYEWAAGGTQYPGTRFIIGVTSLSEAQLYSLDTAQLQTQSTITDYKAKFVDGTGRSFVAASNASLAATAKMLTPDASSMTWPVPYSAMATTAAGVQAYPGAMPVYMTVPTAGLQSGDAHAYATMLRYIVGAGQVAGLGLGQLPDGYLPLTAANGLGALASYTSLAADAVAAQAGAVPALVPVVSTPATTTTATDTLAVPGALAVPVTSTQVTSLASPEINTPTTSAVSPLAITEPTPVVMKPAAAAKPIATPGFGVGFLGLMLPLFLVLGLLGALSSWLLRLIPKASGGLA